MEKLHFNPHTGWNFVQPKGINHGRKIEDVLRELAKPKERKLINEYNRTVGKNHKLKTIGKDLKALQTYLK